MGAAAQAQIEDLNNQMMEMKLTVEGLEKERDFYFGEREKLLLLSVDLFLFFITTGKLRDVEVMCQECEGQGGDVVRKVNIRKHKHVKSRKIFHSVLLIFRR